MSAPEWHLDIVRDDGCPLLLVMIEPQSGRVQHSTIKRFTRLGVIPALQEMMRRLGERPAAIVTDNDPRWFGVADALGVQRRILPPDQKTELERIAMRLIQKMEGDA
ncbi:hypothetical protein [Sphingobium cloacae]|uniref:Transposase n=1 Tax=Sphingobium cloacae TaxID=120107 RepID=A0A1E1F2W2_9SPHN|nr:hypothetical protein [Sphingobium cloacae]BAV64792.1 hypothetical protein SCLO_1017520 [Sphingobium cloacae]